MGINRQLKLNHTFHPTRLTGTSSTDLRNICHIRGVWGLM